MAQIKQYITWQRLWNGSDVGVDLSAQINKNWNYPGREITCIELPYGYLEFDKRLIAIIEYDDEQYSDEVIDRAYKSLNPWLAVKQTPENIIILLNTWYQAPEGEEPYFSLDEDGFTIKDRRDEEECEECDF